MAERHEAVTDTCDILRAVVDLRLLRQIICGEFASADPAGTLYRNLTIPVAELKVAITQLNLIRYILVVFACILIRLAVRSQIGPLDRGNIRLEHLVGFPTAVVPQVFERAIHIGISVILLINILELQITEVVFTHVCFLDLACAVSLVGKLIILRIVAEEAAQGIAHLVLHRLIPRIRILRKGAVGCAGAIVARCRQWVARRILEDELCPIESCVIPLQRLACIAVQHACRHIRILRRRIVELIHMVKCEIQLALCDLVVLCFELRDRIPMNIDDLIVAIVSSVDLDIVGDGLVRPDVLIVKFRGRLVLRAVRGKKSGITVEAFLCLLHLNDMVGFLD